MLAEVAARLGRHDDAEHLLERCLELAPSFHAARQNYALVLHRGNKPEQALAEIETLLKVDAANPSYRNLKAVLLCRIGDYAPAIELYAGILGEYPNNAKIWLSYGHALKTAGMQARAIDAYRKALQLEPAFGEAWWSLANLKTFRFDADDVQLMRRQLQLPRARPGAPPPPRIRPRQGAWRTQADYAASFDHYQRGNALRRDAGALQRRRHLGARAARQAHLYPRVLPRSAQASAPPRPIRSSSSACRAPARR